MTPDLDSKTLSSDFNEAQMQMLRLNDLYIKCNNYSQKGKLSEWKEVLNNIWRELAADTDHSRDKTWNKKINILNRMIDNNINDKSKLYLLLSEKEILLRRLQEDVGKGSKRSHKQEGMM